MSDDEYEYDYGSDAEEENYGSDGGDGNESNGVADELIEIENAFYGNIFGETAERISICCLLTSLTSIMATQRGR